MRIQRDDFDGSGAWSSALWPYAVTLDPVEKPTLTQSGGLGLVSNFSGVDFKYLRQYFGSGAALRDAGLLVRGRFTSAGSNANMRFFLRASRSNDSSSNDLTYMSDGYLVMVDRSNATISLQKQQSSKNVTIANFTVASTPGTQWWNLRLETEGAVVRVKFWYGTLAAEPTTFNRTVTDTSPVVSGEAGFSTGYHRAQVTQLEFFETYDFFTKLILGGVITPAGTMLRRPWKLLTGTTRPGGVDGDTGNGFGTVPFGSGPFGGGTLPSGGSVTVRRVVTRIFGGSITPSGTARRAVVRILRGSISPTASYGFSNITKRLGGSIKPGQPREIVRTPRRIVGGVISLSGDLITRSVGRIQGAPGIVEMTVRVAGEIRSRIRRG